MTIAQQQKAQINQTKILESVQPLLPENIQNELAQAATTAKKTTNLKATIHSSYIYGDKNSTFFDTLLPLLMAMFVFLFVFLISGIALLKERTTGTLERLLATPVRRREIVAGYILGYGFFALIQTSLIIGFVLFVLKIEVLGNVALVLLITILLSFVALIIGIFVSTFAHSEFQMVQFIPLIIVSQVFFSELIPIDGMNPFLQGLAHLMPIYYGATALTDVITKGSGFVQVGWKLAILCLFALIFIFLNVQGLKKYRKV